jgi:uncharacterized protein (DUF2267 family)/RNA polymerase-binding transcription factor DksA
MTTRQLNNIGRTVHKTHAWLKDLREEMGSNDRRRAYQALRATLHALRDRMSADNVAHLGAQLPTLVRGIYYEGWRPAGKPLMIRDHGEFLDLVGSELTGFSRPEAERAVRAVFRMLARHVTPGEIENVRHALPERIRELWTEVPHVADLQESIDDEVWLLREPLSFGDLRVYEEQLRILLDSLQEREVAAETAGLSTSGGVQTREDDEAVEETALAVELGALDAEDELGYAVREALGRVREGVFGVCAVCGEWLSHERLRLVPYARLCSVCASRGA